MVIAHGAYQAFASGISINLFSSTIQCCGSVLLKSGYRKIASVQRRDSAFIGKRKGVHGQLSVWSHTVATDTHIGLNLARLYQEYRSLTGSQTLGGSVLYSRHLSRVES